MTRVIWLSLVPGRGERGAWDMGIVEELTAGPTFEHHLSGEQTYDAKEGAVVIIAGQHNTDYGDLIAAFVNALPWSLVIVTSDEEALFPVELLPHDEKHLIYGQYHARPEFDRVIPIGCPPGTAETLAKIEATHPARMGDVFFGGQNTHARRNELIDVMKDMACDPKYGNLTWAATTGFREGLSQDRYLAALRDTRIAPCPSGPHSLDSFRLYEALAAGALPIVEARTPHGLEPEFWWTMFGDDCPLPIVVEWDALRGIAERAGAKIGNPYPEWPRRRDEVRAWWHQWRAQLALDFHATIERLAQS